MAVSARFASANSAALNSSTAVSVSFAAATAGDRMFAFLTTISASAGPSTPTGWAAEKTFVGYSTFFGVACYSKTAVGTETSVASTLSTGTRWAMGVVILSGANAASPTHTETSRVSPVPATSNALVFPQITPTYDSAFLVEMSGVRYESASTPGSTTISDTNWTKQVDTCTTNTSGAQVGVMIGTRQRATGTTSIQTTAVTASTSPNSLNSNILLAFPATTVADPTAVPPGWDEYRIFKR